ncbi:MAG TPA: ABC transporter ATP-binding protein [Bacillota bacterium]|nr:ABC transporter ATP-binding protein [Bacillota bacterium]
MIKVEELFHSYTGNGRYAIAGVSFEVEKGEIFGFLGPNGAGKSTTQKILTGLLPVQTGRVAVAGQDMRRPTRSLFNRIGVSFENPNAYRKLSGLENLAFHASLYDVPTTDPMALLRRVGLTEAAHRRVGTYSKGMQQRLVFARSLLNRPDIWFVDEPTAGVDPTTTQAIKEIVREERERGVTVFLTTNNMHVADALCDRVAFLNEGKIVTVDSPRELKLKYGQKVIVAEHRSEGRLKREVLSPLVEGDRVELQRLLAAGQVETLHSQEATLEEVFIKLAGRGLGG